MRMPGVLEIFSMLLFSKINFYSMTLCDAGNADLAFVAIEIDERGNALTCLHSVVETLKQHDQVKISCASSHEKLMSFVFCN